MALALRERVARKAPGEGCLFANLTALAVRGFTKMKKLLLIVLVVMGGMKAYEHFQPNFANAQNDSSLSTLVDGDNIQPKRISASFTCDGRTHCSQMTSCEEATFFLKHCPDTKMDGDHDGVPCEQQWCR